MKKMALCLVLLCVFSFPMKGECGQPIVLNGVTYDDETVAKLITVITSTSPVQSIPDAKHLYPAQKSLFRIPAFALCKKIIVFDGVREEHECRIRNTFYPPPGAYEAYKENVLRLTKTDPYFSNTELVFCSEWGHLTGTLIEALKHVTTPFIYVHQHDLQLIQDFDLNALIATMVANHRVQCVMLAGNDNCDAGDYHGPVDQEITGEHFVPLWRCFGWSDQAQITRVDYYKNIILPQCRVRRGNFMEQVMLHRLRYDLAELGVEIVHPIYGTYLYGGARDGSYIMHSDARNN